MSGGGSQTSTTLPPPQFMGPIEQWLGHFEQQALPGGEWTVDKFGNQLYSPPLGGPTAGSPYPTASVEPFSPDQQTAFQAVRDLGTSSPLTGAAASQAQSTLGGGYLPTDPQSDAAFADAARNPYATPGAMNPYMKQYADAAVSGLVNNYQQAIAPGITAQAVREGALGGSGQNQAEQYAKWSLGQNIGDTEAKFYEPAYESNMNRGAAAYAGERQLQESGYQGERNRQLSAIGQTPEILAAEYAPSQALLGIGNLQQTQGQNVRNTDYSNQYNTNMWPWQMFSNFGNSLSGLSGGTQRITGGGGGFK